MHVVGLQNDPIMALALFHTLFNVLGVAMLLPFVSLMAKYLNRFFIYKEPVPTRYIHMVDPKFHETAFVALRDEVNNLFVKTMKFALLLTNIKPNDVFVRKLGVKAIEVNQGQIEFNYKKAYESIKDIESSIFEFVAVLSQQDMTPEKRQSLETLLASVRESVYAAKILKDIKNNILRQLNFFIMGFLLRRYYQDESCKRHFMSARYTFI